MDKEKKTWETPQLIILTRGTPEENVLVSCKTNNPNRPQAGPQLASQTYCASGAIGSCDVCSSRGIGGS